MQDPFSIRLVHPGLVPWGMRRSAALISRSGVFLSEKDPHHIQHRLAAPGWHRIGHYGREVDLLIGNAGIGFGCERIKVAQQYIELLVAQRIPGHECAEFIAVGADALAYRPLERLVRVSRPQFWRQVFGVRKGGRPGGRSDPSANVRGRPRRGA